MTTEELKAYTARAVELEAAIYTQKKLMAEHEKIIRGDRPIEPVIPVLQEPIPPQEPKPATCDKDASQGSLILAGGAIAISIFLMNMDTDLLHISLFFSFFLWGFAIWAVYRVLKDKKQVETQNEAAQTAYEAKLAEYQNRKRQYNIDWAQAKEKYDLACARHKSEVTVYDAKSNKLMAQHSSALAALERTLKEFYAENVIFDKYRNLVAITAIDEYLRSGRCSELEGANGAYNLYEMELRQNIVIGQLSNIINNLEQIKSNQFSLYRELLRANDTVAQIAVDLHNLRETSELTAYFAGITALIEASPKVTYGRIYMH